MQTKNILLRKGLTSKTLRIHIRKFLKSDIFTSDNILLKTLITPGDRYNSTRHLLGNVIKLNIKNHSEIINYIDYITDEFNKMNSKENKISSSKITKISLIYSYE